MTPIGTSHRLRRLQCPATDRILCIPMDHGFSMGATPGTTDMAATAGKLEKGGASCVVVHKGNAASVAGRRFGWLLHLSGSTAVNPDPLDKVLVADVEEGLALGADGISVHVNFGSPTESAQVRDLGRVSRDCRRWGLPLLVMAYARGPAIEDAYDAEVVRQIARASAEAGADVVKTVYTGDPDSFRAVTRGCPVPVIIAGGPRKGDDAEVLAMVADAMEAGAKGVSMGRNVFDHPDPAKMVAALRAVIVDGARAAEASRLLR